MTEDYNDIINHRTFVRANAHVLVRFCPINGVALEAQTRISDISEGGVLMEALGNEFPSGALIKMEFVIPGNGFATVMGKIKYSKPIEENRYRSGIEFINLGEKDRLAIRAYVVSHLRNKGS